MVPDKHWSDEGDFRYVHNGYAPLSVRVLQDYMKYGYDVFTNEKTKQKGSHKLQQLKTEKMCKNIFKIISGNEKDFIESANTPSSKKKRIILFYLGGITFAEIAAIQRYSQLPHILKKSCEFIIATTCIISGDKAIN